MQTNWRRQAASSRKWKFLPISSVMVQTKFGPQLQSYISSANDNENVHKKRKMDVSLHCIRLDLDISISANGIRAGMIGGTER